MRDKSRKRLRGESCRASGQLGTALASGRDRDRRRETDGRLGDSRSLGELRLMDCYVKHALTAKVTHVHVHADTHLYQQASVSSQSINLTSGRMESV